MTNKPVHCDIFCIVVDNYGDAGFCWRLASQLSDEYDWRVRLWIDDPAPLLRLAPDHATGRVEVKPWPTSWLAVQTADVVIETFACTLPPGYIDAMAARQRPPVWLNLEYLSAENWVAGCHGLGSPDPIRPLVKYFFFPGFVERTGGLLRERDYDKRRKDFNESAFREEFGLPARLPNELAISLFSYPNAVLPALVRAWVASSRPIRVLQPGSGDAAITMGSLKLHPLPFLPQRRYDELLWACDLNFVRGEDSFVRAQWAGKPFVWHIYPQADGVHLAKLEAFLARHPAGDQLSNFWHAWNGVGSIDWPDFAAQLPGLDAPTQKWADTLATRPDLASRLVQFCIERLK